jgi:hypothetical protein
MLYDDGSTKFENIGATFLVQRGTIDDNENLSNHGAQSALFSMSSLMVYRVDGHSQGPHDVSVEKPIPGTANKTTTLSQRAYAVPNTTTAGSPSAYWEQGVSSTNH